MEDLKDINKKWFAKKFQTAKRSKRSKQSSYKGIMRVYAELMNNCFMPDCNYGYDLEVHHIQPLGKGGTDTFDNLIVLCKACHTRRKLHSNWQEKQLELLTLKFYRELDILGFTSDCSDEEFKVKIAKSKATSIIKNSK